MNRHAVSMALAVVLLAGCGGEPQSLQSDDIRTFVAGRTGGSDDAQVFGTLVLTHAGRVALDQGDGLVYVLIWPPGTDLNDDGTMIAGGHRFAIGDRVDAGGGYPTLPLSEDLPAVPPDCFEGADDDEVAVIYQASTIN